MKIEGKRILVLDDFTTYGYSLETARRMLLQAGAQRVVCLTIAKYRSNHSVTSISTSWGPFTPCSLQKKDITVFELRGEANQVSDEYFRRNIWEFYKS